MKKILLIIVIVVSVTITKSFSQDMGININFGITPSISSQGDLYFAYVDESPSQDVLISEISLEENKRSFTIGGAFDYKTESNIFFRAGLEAMFGSISGFEVNFGGGYEFNVNDKINIRPILMFSYGSAGIKLGDIYQNDLYIEVNRTRFYSQSVAVKLNRSHFITHPELEFGIPISENTEIMINVGYQIPLNIKTSKLKFSGKDIDNASATASEPITAKNVYLALDGSQFRSNFVDVKGLAFSLGVYFHL